MLNACFLVVYSSVGKKLQDAVVSIHRIIICLWLKETFKGQLVQHLSK